MSYDLNAAIPLAGEVVEVPEYRILRRGPLRRLELADSVRIPSATIRSSADAFALWRPQTETLAVEVAGAAYLDRHNRVLALCTLGMGDAKEVSLSPTSVLTPALMLAECTAVITVHNHLSDPALPSDADVDAFNVLRSGLEPHIRYLDNIIVSPNDGFSFRDAGYLESN